jgi:hypothetical protein
MKAFFIIMGLAALYLLGHLLMWRNTRNLKIPKITQKPGSGFDDDKEDDWRQRPKR